MERFSVSGDDLRNFYNSNIPLAKVFADIENDLRASNQVVCQYILNGLEIQEHEEEKFSKVPLNEVVTLEYLAENSHDITKIVVKGWLDALPELIQKTEQLAQRVRNQGFQGALRDIHELVKNCQFLVESVLAIKETMGDQFFAAGLVHGWRKAELESKRTVLNTLKAFENKDFVQLAEVLEYDLNNVLQMWFDHLKMLEKSIDGEYAGPEFDSGSDGADSMGRRRIAN